MNDHYTFKINSVIGWGRDDLVVDLAAEYDEELRTLADSAHLSVSELLAIAEAA